MAKLPIGTKVFIIETGELGFIIDHFPDFKTAVSVEGETRIVLQSGLVAASEFGLRESSHNAPNKPEKPDFTGIPGLSIGFVPVKNMSGNILHFNVMLVNNTPVSLLFEYAYFTSGVLQQKCRKEIRHGQTVFLHVFKTDALNDSPLINISFWVKEFSSETTGQFNKELRLKAKAFIRKLEDPAFTTSGYLFFELLKEIPSPKQSPQAEQFDWDTYKKQPFTKKITLQDNPVQNIIIRKAHLPDFIDLHIEKLEPGYEALSNAEKLAAQLRHCRTFLENAIAARLDRVYLVHGIGKGILKKEIENLLGTYPEIISYHNQYNPRFGFGATEVLLQKVL